MNEQQAINHQEDEWAGDYNPLGDESERKVVFAALDSFRKYRGSAHLITHRRRQAFYALPSLQWQMLAAPPFSLLDTFSKIDDAIDANAEIAEAIFKNGLTSFGLPEDPTPGSELDWQSSATRSDVSKADSTIRQFYRDWSAEGNSEREVCYGPVLRDLREAFGEKPKPETKVLIPGAGLGRLVLELCLAGYAAEGNEISYHQLMASSWVLNHTECARQYPLYPFALHFSNLKSRRQQLKEMHIPDLHPATAIAEKASIASTNPEASSSIGSMSMSAADFLLLYGSKDYSNCYDAVATVFFLDTAPNVIRYIQTIYNCLRVGGLWINVGPLKWHTYSSSQDDDERNDSEGLKQADYEDKGIAEPGQVELTEEELFLLISKMGFTFKTKDEIRRECGYIQDPDSMLQHKYLPSHWVAVKNS